MQMLTSNGQVFWVAVLVAAVLMIRLGFVKRQLVVRHSVRRCPSCGRLRNGPVCEWCTRR